MRCPFVAVWFCCRPSDACSREVLFGAALFKSLCNSPSVDSCSFLIWSARVCCRMRQEKLNSRAHTRPHASTRIHANALDTLPPACVRAHTHSLTRARAHTKPIHTKHTPRGPVGSTDGLYVGLGVGLGVGVSVSLYVGLVVTRVGSEVGLWVGSWVGLWVGSWVGLWVGSCVGLAVGFGEG